MHEKQVVVDVGIGENPTLLRLRLNEQYQRYGEILFPPNNDSLLQYVGIDIDVRSLRGAHAYMEKYAPHISLQLTYEAGRTSLPGSWSDADQLRFTLRRLLNIYDE